MWRCTYSIRSPFRMKAHLIFHQFHLPSVLPSQQHLLEVHKVSVYITSIHCIFHQCVPQLFLNFRAPCSPRVRLKVTSGAMPKTKRPQRQLGRTRKPQISKQPKHAGSIEAAYDQGPSTPTRGTTPERELSSCPVREFKGDSSPVPEHAPPQILPMTPPPLMPIPPALFFSQLPLFTEPMQYKAVAQCSAANDEGVAWDEGSFSCASSCESSGSCISDADSKKK